MHLATIKQIKDDVIALLSTQAPLSIEEINGLLCQAPAASISLALERLEAGGWITSNRSSEIILTEKSINKLNL